MYTVLVHLRKSRAHTIWRRQHTGKQGAIVLPSLFYTWHPVTCGAQKKKRIPRFDSQGERSEGRSQLHQGHLRLQGMGGWLDK